MKINDVSTHTITTHLSQSLADKLSVLDFYIDIYRSNFEYDIDWQRIYTGFNRTPEYQYTEGRKSLYTIYGRSPEDLLNRRAVAYHAILAQTLKSGPSETVMKEIVNENLGPGASNPSRLRSGVFPSLVIESDLARGPDWFGQFHYENVLDVLQKIATATSTDFKIERTGHPEFTFKVCYPYYGADRRNFVEFSLDRGNVYNATYIKSRTEEITVAIALGSGNRSYRRSVVEESSAKNDSPWNDIEKIVDKGSEETYNGLLSGAQGAIEDNKATESLKFGVLQVPNTQFTRDYHLGDVVRANLFGVKSDLQITKINIVVADNKEQLTHEFRSL